jgi:hypothetical protein
MGTFNGEDIFSAAATVEHESARVYNAVVQEDPHSISELDDECKRTSLAKRGLEYVDERAKVLTYFKLWCSSGSAISNDIVMRRTCPSLTSLI